MHYMRQRRRGDTTITLKPGPKPGAKASSREEVEKLEQQNAVLRQERAAVKRKVAQAGVADEKLLRETILLRHEVAILKRQLAHVRAAKPDEEAAKLRKRVRELQARLRELADAPRGIVFMAKADRRKVLLALHPDRRASASEEQLTEAFQIFKALPLSEV